MSTRLVSPPIAITITITITKTKQNNNLQDNEHKIGYLTKDLQLQKNYDISWENWNRYLSFFVIIFITQKKFQHLVEFGFANFV